MIGTTDGRHQLRLRTGLRPGETVVDIEIDIEINVSISITHDVNVALLICNRKYEEEKCNE